MKQKALCAWSGGKDSTMALNKILCDHSYEVVALLTTITQDYDRVSMHGVRTELLEAQAKAIGLPLEKVLITAGSDNDEYESAMRTSLLKYKKQGISTVIFGDIFLEDLKKYREEKLTLVDMKGEFPLWKRNTTELGNQFISSGFKTILTCVDSQCLSGEFAGRYYDSSLLKDLPNTVDPCGENGEFHSFAFEGPLFKEKITFTKGEVVIRDERFYFCDLIPEKSE